jgi:hypothetical protein
VRLAKAAQALIMKFEGWKMAVLVVVALLAPAQKTVATSGQVIDEITKASVAGAPAVRLTDRVAKSVVVETDDAGRFALRRASRPIAFRRWPRLRAAQVWPARPQWPDASGGDHRPRPLERGDRAEDLRPRLVGCGQVIAEAQTNDLGEPRLFDLVPGPYASPPSDIWRRGSTARSWSRRRRRAPIAR